MDFKQLGITPEVADTLEVLFEMTKKINPSITRAVFIDGIFKEWMEPYRMERKGEPVTREEVKLHNNLKQAITFSGKSQVQLAKEIGISRTYLGQIVNYKCEPTITVALLIARALNYPPYELHKLFYLEPAVQG